MKVLLVTGAFPLPSETFVHGIAKGLVEKGIDVKILAFDDGRFVQNCPFKVDQQLMQNVVRGRSTPRSRLGRLIGTLKTLVSGKITFYSALRLFWPALIDRAQCYHSYYALAEGLNGAAPFDILHAQFGHLGRMLAVLKEVGIIKTPLVTTFHGGDTTIFMRRHPDGYKNLYKQAGLLLAVSEKLREWHLKAGCDSELVKTFYDVIDIRDWSFVERRSLGQVKLLTVGRLVEKKGFAYCIDAVAQLQKWGIDATLDIAGDGPLYETLLKHAESKGVSARVNLVGWKSKSEIGHLMGTAHAFICCSVIARDGDEEGIPNTIKEAMASGLPVIASRHAGIPEIVIDGITGRLVDEKNGSQVALAVRELIEDPLKFQKMARAARAHIEEKHEVGALSKVLIREYRSLLDYKI